MGILTKRIKSIEKKIVQTRENTEPLTLVDIMILGARADEGDQAAAKELHLRIQNDSRWRKLIESSGWDEDCDNVESLISGDIR